MRSTDSNGMLVIPTDSWDEKDLRKPPLAPSLSGSTLSKLIDHLPAALACDPSSRDCRWKQLLQLHPELHSQH